jgi:hypothetical protein
MTAGESTGAANDVAISADDLVDVLLKESALSSAGGGHLMRSAGSPVIVGSSSPMFRRRRRSGVQLAEPLTVSRERTPSPRLAIFVSADDSISGSSTPEPVVESVSSKMTAKTTMTSRCDLEAPQDEQRRRRSADSTLASRSGSSDNLLASIQRAKDDARLMERQQSHIEEQKRRDHEARREERRRLSLQANRLLCSDVLQVPSSGQNSNCRQESIHRVSSDGSSQKICANSSDQRQVTVTSSSLNMTKNPLSETDSNKRSDENDACSSRLQIGVADSTSKPSSRQVASHDIMSSSNMHRESLRRHDGVMLDRADFADDSSKRPSHFQQTEADNRRAVHLSMLPCDDRGGSQSAVCSGSKSLKERFHCLSMMYASADNEDSFETAHNSRVSMSSVAPPPVNLTLTPLSRRQRSSVMLRLRRLTATAYRRIVTTKASSPSTCLCRPVLHRRGIRSAVQPPTSRQLQTQVAMLASAVLRLSLLTPTITRKITFQDVIRTKTTSAMKSLARWT